MFTSFYFKFKFDQIMCLYRLSYHSGNEIRIAKMFKLWLLANHNYQKLIIVKTWKGRNRRTMQIIVPLITRSNQSTRTNKTIEKRRTQNEYMSKYWHHLRKNFCNLQHQFTSIDSKSWFDLSLLFGVCQSQQLKICIKSRFESLNWTK